MEPEACPSSIETRSKSSFSSQVDYKSHKRSLLDAPILSQNARKKSVSGTHAHLRRSTISVSFFQADYKINDLLSWLLRELLKTQPAEPLQYMVDLMTFPEDPTMANQVGSILEPFAAYLELVCKSFHF
jgi:hypothetical protein